MEEDIKILGEPEKIELINLLRTFKREGIENFIVVRRKKLENLIKGYRELEEDCAGYEEQIDELVSIDRKHRIPKSKIKEKIEPVIDSLEKNGFVGYADELRDIISELMKGE